VNILIRVDASEKIGSGHFFRCFLLAKSLKNNNNNIHFLSSNLNNEYKKKLIKENFFLHKLNNKKNSLKNDINQTISKIKKINKDINLMIVDNYKINYFWETKIKRYVKKILVIDDFEKKHNCDFYLNYNKNKIKNFFLPKFCLKLVGPKYAILNPTYLKKDKKIKTIKKNIFIFMGGADRKNYTLRFIKHFKKSKFKNFIFNFVIGINNKKKKEITQLSKKVPNYKVFYNLKNLKNLMSYASFAISNGGQVIWELIFSKVPNVIFCKNNYKNNIVSKNKKKIGLDIFEIKNDKTFKVYLKKLDNLLINQKTNSINNFLIDGKGLKRISKLVTENL
tara:strand:+ start:26 stop:1033 length:1008 start_codon:yes stop_codon:yes gene_type:complete